MITIQVYACCLGCDWSGGPITGAERWDHLNRAAENHVRSAGIGHSTQVIATPRELPAKAANRAANATEGQQ